MEWDDSIDGEGNSVRLWRDEMLDKGERPVWSVMPKLLQGKMYEENTRVKGLKESHDEKYRTTTRQDGKDMMTYREIKANIDVEFMKKLAEISRGIEHGTADFNKLQSMYSAAQTARHVSSAALLNQFPSVDKKFRQLRAERATSDTIFVGDLIYDAWQDGRHNPEWTDAEGN